MSKITDYSVRAVRFVRSRVGAVLLLAVSCLVCAVVFSSYITPVDISDGEETATFMTMRNDARGIIVQSGIALSGNDDLEVSFDQPDGKETISEIHINRSFDVTVCDGGVSTVYQTKDGSVNDLLDRYGITLGENDRMNVSETDRLYEAMYISIDRVTYEEKTSTEIIPCKTVKVDTDELLKGETRTITAGSDGMRTVVTRYTFVNGELVTSERVSENITAPVTNRVVQVGTASSADVVTGDTRAEGETAAAEVNTFSDSAGRTVTYKKMLTGKGSAYTREKGSITETGREIEAGVVAVDPKVIPYGTRLYITSKDGKYVYGYALAADTNESVETGSVIADLYFDSVSQCRVFGRRDIVIYILED